MFRPFPPGLSGESGGGRAAHGGPPMCWNVFDENPLEQNFEDPRGPDSHALVLRGGAYWNKIDRLRPDSRRGTKPIVWGIDMGFRCVRSR